MLRDRILWQALQRRADQPSGILAMIYEGQKRAQPRLSIRSQARCSLGENIIGYRTGRHI